MRAASARLSWDSVSGGDFWCYLFSVGGWGNLWFCYGLSNLFMDRGSGSQFGSYRGA